MFGEFQDDGLGARSNRGGDAIKIQLTAIVGLDYGHAPAVILDVEKVLGEIGGQDDDLVTGVEQRFEQRVDSSGRSHGHDDVFAREGNAGARGEPSGHLRADRREAGVGHVTVASAVFGGHPAKRLEDHLRRVYFRVAQRVVEDVLRPSFLAKLDADLEHPANPGRVLHLLGDGSGDAHSG